MKQLQLYRLRLNGTCRQVEWVYLHNHHNVFLGMDGTVYDPMRPHANGVPFDQWVESWQYWQELNFGYLSPDQFPSGIRW